MQTQQAPSTDRMWLFGAIAVALALLLAVITWWLTRPEDLELTGLVPPTTTSTSSTTSTVPDDEPEADLGGAIVEPQPSEEPVPEGPPPTLDPEDPATQQINEIIEFVEQARGLDFIEPPLVQLLGDDAFIGEYNTLVEETIAEDPEDYEIGEHIFWALGYLDTDVTRRELDTAFGAAGIVGFYNTEDNELFVRTNGGELTPYVKRIVAHELVHALDDQHFELFRPEYDDVDDERGFALSALAEGNANRIEGLYLDSLSDDERRQAQEQPPFSGGDLSIFRDSFFELIFAPYEYGEPFVNELFDRDGNDGLSEAFTEPPRTTEVILHPERFFAGEGYEEIDAPPANGEVLDEGIFGELVLRAMLVEVMGRPDAAAAADGWAGDHYVFWYEGDQACIRADIVMDSVAEAEELRDGLRLVADRLPDAVLETAGGGFIRFTSCVEVS